MQTMSTAAKYGEIADDLREETITLLEKVLPFYHGCFVNQYDNDFYGDTGFAGNLPLHVFTVTKAEDGKVTLHINCASGIATEDARFIMGIIAAGAAQHVETLAAMPELETDGWELTQYHLQFANETDYRLCLSSLVKSRADKITLKPYSVALE